MDVESRELLNFLKKQNHMLKDEVSELKQLLKLNKEALLVSIKYKKNDERSLPELVNLLYQENSKLSQKVESFRAEIESGMCQALISEQIAFASTEQEVYLTNELRDRLLKMRKELESKETKIINMLKQKSQSSNTYSAESKVVEFTDAAKVSKKLKDSISVLNEELDSKKAEIADLKEQKEELFKLNLVLTKQINELKLVSCQTTKSNNHPTTEQNRDSSNRSPSQHDLSKYIKYQKNLTSNQEAIDSSDNSNSGSEDSDFSDSEEEYDELEDASERHGGLADQSLTNTHDLSISKQEEKPSKANLSIPKLQLSKAKHIQDLIVKKINNDQKKKKESTTGGTVKEEKYKKLEEEIEKLRKKMGREIMEKLSVERQNVFLKRMVTELQNRNELLASEREVMQQEHDYSKMRKLHEKDNIETLLDICRDVTLNQRLKEVILGRLQLKRKEGIQWNEC